MLCFIYIFFYDFSLSSFQTVKCELRMSEDDYGALCSKVVDVAHLQNDFRLATDCGFYISEYDNGHFF